MFAMAGLVLSLVIVLTVQSLYLLAANILYKPKIIKQINDTIFAFFFLLASCTTKDEKQIISKKEIIIDYKSNAKNFKTHLF